ncbi:unnamed protein product [Rhodiola kirilowii]
MCLRNLTHGGLAASARVEGRTKLESTLPNTMYKLFTANHLCRSDCEVFESEFAVGMTPTDLLNLWLTLIGAEASGMGEHLLLG